MAKERIDIIKELAPLVWVVCGAIATWGWNFFNKNIEDKDKLANTAIDKLISGVSELTASVNKLTTKLSILEVIAEQHAEDIKEIKDRVRYLENNK